MKKVLFVVIGILVVLAVAAGLLLFSKNPKTALKGTPSGNITNPFQNKGTSSDTSGYACIFPTDCSKAEPITAENVPAPTFYGLGFNVPSGTPIRAAIAGKVGIGVSTDAKGQKFNTLSVLDEKQKIEADYSFMGKPFDPSSAAAATVGKGDVIGWVGDGTLTFRGNQTKYNLIFYVTDNATKTFKKISVSDLK
ncbi:MAG: hypothetical protein ACM3IJ_01760 [Candidatus Levyibacteriota bacterium]